MGLCSSTASCVILCLPVFPGLQYGLWSLSRNHSVYWLLFVPSCGAAGYTLGWEQKASPQHVGGGMVFIISTTWRRLMDIFNNCDLCTFNQFYFRYLRLLSLYILNFCLNFYLSRSIKGCVVWSGTRVESLLLGRSLYWMGEWESLP